MHQLESVLSALELVIFEVGVNGDFTLRSQPPSWLNEIYPNLLEQEWNVGQTIELMAASSDIERFVMKSHQHWMQSELGDEHNSTVATTTWTETSSTGAKWELEGQAFTSKGRRYISIRPKPDANSPQNTNSAPIVAENIRSNIGYRQRKLFSQVEEFLTSNKESSAFHIASSSQFATLMIDTQGQVLFANSVFKTLYNDEFDGGEGAMQIYDRWLKNTERFYPEIHRQVASGKYWEGEFQETHLSGETRWLRLSIGSVFDQMGAIKCRMCSIMDISDWIPDSLSEFEDGYFDSITNLPSRKYLWTYFQNLEFEPSKPCDKLAFFYIDLDHFKRVNLRYGHATGDFVLNTTATRLLRNIKRSDLLVNLGGDTFGVLLACTDANTDLENIGQRLQNAITETIAIDGSIVTVSASIGAYVTELQFLDPRETVYRAYLAAYSAKQLGRSQLRFYENDLEDHLPKRKQRELELEQSLKENRFELYFQSKVNTKNADERAYEVLLRWNHPQEGLLEPRDFITLAEETDLIIPMGDWIIERTCATGALMRKRGYTPKLAVNVTAKQIQHPDFVSKLEQQLSISQFPAKDLELEITETNLLQNLKEVKAKLVQLRLLGVSIALDDFGSGYSSLNYLRILPIDVLKIDRSFIKDLPEDRESAAIATWVINLAHKLDLTIVAEGAETAEQVKFLNKKKVHYLQGYYFSEPVSEQTLLDSL